MISSGSSRRVAQDRGSRQVALQPPSAIFRRVSALVISRTLLRLESAIYGGRWPLWLLMGLVLVGSFAIAPSTLARADQYPVKLCPFRTLTGLPDAGCGLTRSFNALCHGRLRAAIDLHPFGPSLFGLLAAWWLVGLVEILRGKPWDPPWRTPLEMGLIYVVGAALMAFGIWRLAHIASTGGLAPAWNQWNQGLLGRMMEFWPGH